MSQSPSSGMGPHPVQPVVICGGAGSRLWPLSRTGFPKQFLCLTGDQSLFQLAAQRLNGLAGDGAKLAGPLIVGNEEHRFLGIEQLREVGIELKAALLEPAGRNTAPALTLAALAAVEDGRDAILVVTPADQVVADESAFNLSMQRAIHEAAQGVIAILGVAASRPETGYGYIQTVARSAAGEAVTVRRFVEKPTAPVASAYVQEGATTGTRACSC